jgi:hypothetical protein
MAGGKTVGRGRHVDAAFDLRDGLRQRSTVKRPAGLGNLRLFE